MAYELNGSDAKSAALWFFLHEYERHQKDCEAIKKDIDALILQGVKLPDWPPLDTFITVPGVDYDTGKQST